MTEVSRPSAALERLNQLPDADARPLLTRCCGAARWVEGMLQARPFASLEALFARADSLWRELDASDYRDAFAHHPEIGAELDELRRKFAATADLSQREQASVAHASDATLRALRDGNRAYRERFGYSFIVCATGKSADEMLQLLERRLANDSELELAVAAEEQAKITRLRLEQLVS